MRTAATERAWPVGCAAAGYGGRRWPCSGRPSCDPLQLPPPLEPVGRHLPGAVTLRPRLAPAPQGAGTETETETAPAGCCAHYQTLSEPVELTSDFYRLYIGT